MGVRSISAPTSTRGRRAVNPLTDAEAKQVIKLLQAGETPGPDEEFDTEKAARRVIGQWVRQIKELVDFPVGTRAWQQENDKYVAVLRVKDE